MRIVDTRMIHKISAYQAAVPAPFVLGICSCVYAYKAPSGLNVALKISFLIWIEHISGRAEEDYCGVLREILLVEVFRIFSGVDFETVFGAELLDRGDSSRDGFMVKSCRLAEYQDFGITLPLFRTSRKTQSDSQQQQE